eukprot:8566021-Alexandrium_andersonii.AAC.1
MCIRDRDCVHCGLADCRLEPAMFVNLHLRAPASPAFVNRFGISMKNCAERAPRELRGPI